MVWAVYMFKQLAIDDNRANRISSHEWCIAMTAMTAMLNAVGLGSVAA